MRNDMTRHVRLWLTNVEGDYNYWSEAAEEAWRDQDPDDRGLTRLKNARHDLAKRLRNELDNESDETSKLSPMYADLLTAALQQIDWEDLADVMLAELPEVAEIDE